MRKILDSFKIIIAVIVVILSFMIERIKNPLAIYIAVAATIILIAFETYCIVKSKEYMFLANAKCIIRQKFLQNFEFTNMVKYG